MNVTKQLYQWDTGQKLTECTGIYVDYLIGDEVYRVEITDGTCIIPDELLQTSGRYKVWECMADNTLREFAFKVLPRPIPPNYVFTPTEQLTFEGLVQKETNKFNTNAIEKLNAYNANADNRVAEFNAQTEQIQTDVSELKSDLADISNILADVEVLTPTIEENKIYSNSYHSGLPLSDYNTYTFSVEEGKTYYISTKVVGIGGYAVYYKFKNGTWVEPVGEYPSYSGIVTDFEFVCGNDCDEIKITVANDTTPNVKTIGLGKKNVYAEIEKVKPTYNNFVKRQGDEIYIKAKYGASHDIVFRINIGGGNNLPDIRYVYLVRNDGVLNNDLTSERYILSNPSDIFSPHIMSATNNADGDHIDEVNYFTGGNHRSNNTGSGGGVTAHNLLFNVYCDDNEVIDSEAFGNKVTVKWTNTIAGYNTSKDDGTGREILKEEITLEIVGSLISVTIIHTALESLSRITYFGLQMYCDNMEKIRYIGGANRSEYNPQGASNSGNKNCRNIVLSNPTNKDSIEIGIDNIDLGDFSLDSLQYSAFTTIVKKSYFGILYDSNLQMNENDSTVVKGYYHFKPMLVN